MERDQPFGKNVGKLHGPQWAETGQKVADFQTSVSGWQIYWHRGWNEAGKFEVHFIVRTPDTTPISPHRAEVMQIFGAVCNHVECVPEFVSAGAGWCYWIYCLTAKKLTVQPLLLGPAAKCGCDPWLDPRASREVYESIREWLELVD